MDAYDDAVRQIVATVVSQTLLATNREKNDLIKDGVQVTFRNAEGERLRRRLRIFDFTEPENNHFLLAQQLGSMKDEQEKIQRRRQIEWMRETRAAVVVNEEQGEVDKFRKWALNITPHRKLIKEGIELPKSMRAEPRFRNMQRMDLDEAFKEREHPFRIAIVCAMWLTGFERNAAIIAAKEAANENDETRKRFEVMCREVFKKFKACLNVRGVNAQRADYVAGAFCAVRVAKTNG